MPHICHVHITWHVSVGKSANTHLPYELTGINRVAKCTACRWQKQLQHSPITWVGHWPNQSVWNWVWYQYSFVLNDLTKPDVAMKKLFTVEPLLGNKCLGWPPHHAQPPNLAQNNLETQITSLLEKQPALIPDQTSLPRKVVMQVSFYCN